MFEKLKQFFSFHTVICLFLIAACTAITYNALAFRPPIRAAESYLRALAGGDTEAALEFSTGNAAWSASRLKEISIKADVDRVGPSVAALGRGWARVSALVELTLQDGSADVGWYSIDVVKTEQGWKVASIREHEPDVSGTGTFVKKTDTTSAEQVFRSYIDELATGNLQGSLKYLVGPTRKRQEISAAVLGKGAVIGEVEELKAEPVWKRGKSMLVRFDYKADGRDVSVTATYYKTKQGWKITKIVQN